VEMLADNADVIGEAALTTLWLTLFSFAGALVVGILIASFRVSPIKPLEWFATAFVSIFRNTPLLVVFFMFHFGLRRVGLDFGTGFRTAVAVMAMYTGAYMAEVIRSGINAVPPGQAEAGRAIGLPFTGLLATVVIPQAVRTVIAPIGNLFAANAKNTSIALTIGVVELTSAMRRLINQTAETWAAIIGIALIYTVVLLIAGQAFRLLEQRYAIKR